MHVVRGKHLDAAILRRVRADADLDGAVGIDDALAHGAADERAVRQLLSVVAPGVLMRVELHQRQRPVFLRMRLQERPGDEMVAAEREEMHVGVEDRARLRLDRLGDGQRIVQVERHVAVIDRREVGEDVEAEGILRVAVEDRRGAADRLRAEARARPVGHRHVERDAEDREVDAGQVAAVAPAHERERAGIGRVVRAALQRGGAEGVIDRRLAGCVGHDGAIRYSQRRDEGRGAPQRARATAPTPTSDPDTLTLD